MISAREVALAPIRRAIGMNSGGNVFGQGNRANATIGRALQLVVRNIGGGRPGYGGIDRAALGAPSTGGWCFAEDEEGLPDGWPPLSVERGFEPGQNTVTLFAGHGCFNSNPLWHGSYTCRSRLDTALNR